MTSHYLLVFSDPVKGRDDEYNRWYNEQHLDDVLQVPGFIAAQRLSIDEGIAPNGCRNLAIYELETDKPASVLANLVALTNTDAMPLTDALDMASISTLLVTRVGPRKEAKSAT